MSVKQLFLVTLVAFVWPVAAEAQVFEITRELGAPQHNYFNNPPFGTSTTDALPVPALPNVQFAITGNGGFGHESLAFSIDSRNGADRAITLGLLRLKRWG